MIQPLLDVIAAGQTIRRVLLHTSFLAEDFSAGKWVAVWSSAYMLSLHAPALERITANVLDRAATREVAAS